jgi:acetylornithine deacetylase/succinyl-diaminopimelate desuccinylase-like protein
MTSTDVPLLDLADLAVARNAAELLSVLENLVVQPSISATGDGIGPMADLVAATMERFGLRAEVRASDGNPIVLGRRDASDQAPTVLFYGHYDVQPAGSLEGWTTPPFRPSVRDGRMFGRGTADSKGQLLAMLAGISAAAEVQPRLPCNVLFLAEGEEEIGSPNLQGFVERHRDELLADAAYMGDGAIHPSGRPLMALGSRGLLCVELAARDERHDLHSGNFGGIVDSPAFRLSETLLSLQDNELFQLGAAPPSSATLDGLSQLEPPALPAGTSYGDELDDYWVRVCTRPSLNVSGLEAGYVGPGFQTVIPARAVARVDVRLVPGQRPTDVYEALAAHVQGLGLGVTTHWIAGTPPAQTDPGHIWVRTVAAQLEAAYGKPPVILPVLPGTVPMGVFVEALGIPTLVVPHANADQRNHAIDENLQLSSLQLGARTVARLLLSMADTNLTR